MYNTYANAIKDPDKRQLYGYTNNKMAAAVTLAIREYVNRKGAQFPVVTQLGGGGGGGGSGDACTLESCPSSRQLAQKDEKKYDKVETWFNAVQMAGPTNLRQLVTAYNKHQEKKLDLTQLKTITMRKNSCPLVSTRRRCSCCGRMRRAGGANTTT